MFTGIVDYIGSLVKSSGSHLTFSVPERLLDSVEIGGSLSINGACLTAVDIDSRRERLEVDVARETSQRTNIGNLRPGDSVNLELPLGVTAFSEKLDGHLVQGHVDALGKIGRIEKEQNNWVFRISTPRQFGKYLVNKGSVAVDGISLTPYQVTRGTFSTSVIPHTYNNTTLQFKRSGSEVNIEFDILAKYISKNMKGSNY